MGPYPWTKQVQEQVYKRIMDGNFTPDNLPFLEHHIEYKLLKTEYDNLFQRHPDMPLIDYLKQSKNYNPYNVQFDIEFLRRFILYTVYNIGTPKDIELYLQEKQKEDDSRSFVQVAFSTFCIIS